MNTLPKQASVRYGQVFGGSLLMGLGMALLTGTIATATVPTGQPTEPDTSTLLLTPMTSLDTTAALKSQPSLPGSAQFTIAQLFKKPPSSSTSPAQNPSNCGPQGCRLSIDQTLLPSGQRVMTRYQGKAQQIIQTGETRDLTLHLVDPIVNRAGQVVVPGESEITGQVVPIEGGGQFIAKHITVKGKPYTFPAQSDTLHDVKDPRETSAGSIAGDAAIGAAGGAVIGQVLNGNIGLGEVLVGAATGVIVGNVTAPRTVVISTGDQIELQLTEAFKL